MKLSQLFGFTGTLVVAVAYIPQIQHLIKEHCSAGISVRAYSLWFLASLLFLVHAFMIKDVVFVFVQVVNLTAICAIVIYCKKYANQMCLMHLKKFKQLGTPKIGIVFGIRPDGRLSERIRKVSSESQVRRTTNEHCDIIAGQSGQTQGS